MILDFVTRLSTLNRPRKRAILIAHDLVAMAVALWAAFSTRLGEPYFPDNPVVLLSAAASFAIGIAGLYWLKVYRFVLRFFDLQTVSRIFFGAAIASGAWVMLIYFTRAPISFSGLPILVPRSVGFIYCGFLFLLLFMGRFLMARLLTGAGRITGYRPVTQRSVAIYGASSAGISLADSMRPDPNFRLCGFIEDDPALHGQILAGVPIYPPKALQGLIDDCELTEIFLAMPRASRTQRLEAISRTTELGLQVKTIPAPEEIVSGRYTVSDVRPISVGDLLRRDPVEPLRALIDEAVRGHTILITGAGGSIGSEICRQILQARPAKMVLLDHSEFALYAIEQQLCEARDRLPEADRPPIVPIVGSMLNEPLVREVIRNHAIDSIFHAAAYKHVPLLEHNEVVGVENNVVGTEILARAAYQAKLTRFIMISTDKAVRPKSVMGASKRVAELIVQAYADLPDCSTRFGIVRFGNVLDSSGSVVQRFRQQIREGGPITVTHRDITRFFMSIPEATQLVLQASALATRGEVFVLDMGEPIKIADLARNMINLAGMSVRDDANPLGDIEIQFVGLRPGEKLYEELFVGEETLDTRHPRIRMARERFLKWEELRPQTDRLFAAVKTGDAGAVRSKLGDLIRPDQGALEDFDASGVSMVIPLEEPPEPPALAR
ncbi:MAG TPA: nucleoside-diphosphate sugar epimerase/dehydratase [Allosphingosinicella sp.]|jgi:FlaA1/EpsC-like NDP-sugar epimerase